MLTKAGKRVNPTSRVIRSLTKKKGSVWTTGTSPTRMSQSQCTQLIVDRKEAAHHGRKRWKFHQASWYCIVQHGTLNCFRVF